MHRPYARLLLAALLPLLAAALLVACESDGGGGRTPTPAASAAPPDKVTFMAGFKPQANLPFVGAYVAKEKGFFAEQNLEVEIQHVNTPGDNFKFLGLGQVQFSTADAATVIERAGDDPPLGIVAIALIGQRGQQGFAADISSPDGAFVQIQRGMDRDVLELLWPYRRLAQGGA